MFTPDQQDIIKAIHRSQHCQRNWDLSKEIPEEDMEVLVTAATQCPSKQNIAFYKAHFITNRSVIEELHSHTDGFTVKFVPRETTTNSQTLANLLIVFEENNFLPTLKGDIPRTEETLKYLVTGKTSTIWHRDRDMAIGVAAGYVNVVASIMGYSTGCCACFNDVAVQQVLNLENKPILMMGVGFKNLDLNRRIHHADHSYMFPTKSKQPIPVSYIK
jgi:hypothetical protein